MRASWSRRRTERTRRAGGDHAWIKTKPALTLDLVMLAVGEDKSADQADTIGTVRRLHRRGSAAETIRRAEPG